MSAPPTVATTPVRVLASVVDINPGIRYTTMPIQMINRNPLRMYLAALLPLCRKRIMYGKLQRKLSGLRTLYIYGGCVRNVSGNGMKGPKLHVPMEDNG